MKKKTIVRNAAFFEDFDIIKLNSIMPEYIVGVNINTIYATIVIYAQNPSRKNKVEILRNAVLSTECLKGKYVRFVPMPLSDICFCFEERLKKLPKNTFIQILPFI